MKNAWNFIIAGIFVFLAVLMLTSVVHVASEYKHAQLLVEPTFGQLTGQAWDSWRHSVLNLFSFFSF